MAIGNILGQRLAQGMRGDFTGKSIGAYLVSTDANGTMQWQDTATFNENIQDVVGSFVGSSTRIVPTYNDTSNTLTFDIAANSITGSQLGQIPGLSVRGNATNATANQSDITFTADGQVLVRSGTTLTTALIGSSNISNSAISLAKIVNIGAGTVLANLTGASAAPTAVTTAQLKAALLNIPTIVTGTTQTISAGAKYIANNAAEIVFSLPLTSVVGDFFEIIGYGGGGYRVNQTVAGQLQIFTGISTTAGITSGNTGTIRSGSGEHFASAYWVCVSISPITWLCVPGVGTAWRIDE